MESILGKEKSIKKHRRAMYALGTERRQVWLGHITREGFGTHGSLDWVLRDVYY